MCGLPRSGKSTIARKWTNYEIDIHRGEVKERNKSKSKEENPRVVVNADAIRLTFGSRFDVRHEDYVVAVKNTMIKALLLTCNDVMVDGTHTKKSSIAKLFEIDQDADYAVVNTPGDVCKARAIATDQSDLLPVIDRMVEQMSKLPPLEEIRKEVIDYINDIHTRTI